MSRWPVSLPWLVCISLGVCVCACCVWGTRKRGLDKSFSLCVRLVSIVGAIDSVPTHAHSPCLSQGHVEHGESAHAQTRRHELWKSISGTTTLLLDTLRRRASSSSVSCARAAEHGITLPVPSPSLFFCLFDVTRVHRATEGPRDFSFPIPHLQHRWPRTNAIICALLHSQLPPFLIVRSTKAIRLHAMQKSSCFSFASRPIQLWICKSRASRQRRSVFPRRAFVTSGVAVLRSIK